jgi:hypothetical protein
VEVDEATCYDTPVNTTHRLLLSHDAHADAVDPGVTPTPVRTEKDHRLTWFD